MAPRNAISSASRQHEFFHRGRHGGIGLPRPGKCRTAAFWCNRRWDRRCSIRAGLSVREALAPIFPGATSIQIGGTTHMVHLSPLGTRSTAYPLQDGRILYSATAPGARDSAIYVCDPDTRQEKLVYNIANYCEFDAVPVLVQRPLARRLCRRKR